jgi:hypothetical protein
MWHVVTGLLGDVAIGLAAFVGAHVVMARIVCAPPGAALVLHGRGAFAVSFRWRLRWLGEQCAAIPLGPHTLTIALRGKDAVTARDGRTVEVVAHATLALPRDADVVREAIPWLGLDATAHAAAIDAHIRPHVAHAVRAAMSTFSGAEVYARHEDLRARVVELASPHLRGMRLQALALSSAQLIPHAAAEAARPRACGGSPSAPQDTPAARRRRRSLA